MRLQAAMRQARERNFRDPDTDGEVRFDDPLESAAIALMAMRWQTPEVAAGDVRAAAGQSVLAAAWNALEPADRQLYRRRAWTIVAIATNGALQLDATPATPRADWG